MQRNALGSTLSGFATAGVGAAGAGLGLAGVFGTVAELRIDWLVPLLGVQLRIDALSGFFMVLTGAVAVAAGLYWIGYARHENYRALPLVTLPLFVVTLLAVPAAGSVTTFLLTWELMALTSLVLVLTDQQRSEVRSAALIYAVMTQLGFVTLLLGMVVLAARGGDDFAGIGPLSEPVRNTVFVLTLIGFGSKAGLLPLHAWLPRAHPEAPSPVSALLSAAMVNLGIYGIIRIDLQILGHGPRWWGLTLLIVGGASAMYGVLQASVATDLKRLLAYSTTENIGLITLALGAAALLSGSGCHTAAAVAAVAALLHLIAHAAFKSLGFLAAGSVLAATGLRDLDRLGGLARRMPGTTALFGVAALGAAGLPLGAGFVSEWLLIQSLMHARADNDITIALVTPLAVGAVALTAGLGVAAMVKAFGIGFLARPRSEAAEAAREAPTAMLAGMTLPALACAVLAIAPGIFGPLLGRVLDILPLTGEAPALGTYLRIPGLDASMSPGLLAAALATAVAVVLIGSRWHARRRPAPATVPLWACGATELSPRMQYTATSFAQPLQQVFDDVLHTDTAVEVTRQAPSSYIVERIAYRARVADVIEDRWYAPVLRAVADTAQLVRRAHTGSVHLYLAYGAIGVLIAMLVAR
ncbi:proton-conducting transporter membrane subunit [[Mycobacterium] kokjensenii]|uniref:Proton-conducting transporter membrane subunit n=1 Tax=[Mycobacterium] kokjensenii TaxID=3064287 RepID=A0ABM9LK85_9MYCO|nr:proton-conducting transporter membrane subunit [Mycolicibacter sp. MU0083]CAJ1500427.1 proton-conducting transporter membrane subunit [Mycolicibacter sp. MU0083]